MEKILESLKKMLPEDAVNEVAQAVEGMISKVRKDLTNEFNLQLEEAYAELAAEKEEVEKTALSGYHEAYALINDLRGRMELMREEYEQELEEGFTEAYQMIKDQKRETESLSSNIYNEYDGKFDVMKNHVVDALDQFLNEKGPEIYEQARRDVLNDPRTAEHKVAMDRIAEIVSGYVTEDEKFFANGQKLDEARRAIKELQSQLKMVEGRNIKLSQDNVAAQEKLRESYNYINESRINERKGRKNKQVSGRGRVVSEDRVEVISEYNNQNKRQVREYDDDDGNETFNESLNLGVDKKTLNLLAGTRKER